MLRFSEHRSIRDRIGSTKPKLNLSIDWALLTGRMGDAGCMCVCDRGRVWVGACA